MKKIINIGMSLLSLVLISNQNSFAQTTEFKASNASGTHTVKWGFAELRLPRFMEIDKFLEDRYGIDHNTWPTHIKTKYGTDSRAQKVVDATKYAVSQIPSEMRRIRLSYMAELDFLTGIDLEDFMFDTDNSTIIEPDEYRAQLKDLIVTTLDEQLNGFDIVYCINDFPYNINTNEAMSCLNRNTLMTNPLAGVAKFRNELKLDVASLTNINTAGIPFDLSSEFYNSTIGGVSETRFKYNKFHPDYLDQTKNQACNYTISNERYQFSTALFMDYLRDLIDEMEQKQVLSRTRFEIINEADLPINYWGTPTQFVELNHKIAEVFLEKGINIKEQYTGGFTQNFPTNKKINPVNPTGNAATTLAYYKIMDRLPPFRLAYHVYPGINSKFINEPNTLETKIVDEYDYTYEEFQSTIGTINNENYFIGDGKSLIPRLKMSEAMVSEYNQGLAFTEKSDGTENDDHCSVSNNTLDATDAHFNSGAFIYELGILLKYLTENKIPEVYLHNLIEGTPSAFFDQNGNEKEAFRQFKKVFNIIKAGYQLDHMVKQTNVSGNFINVIGVDGKPIEYLEIKATDVSVSDNILRIALSDGVPFPESGTTIVDSYGVTNQSSMSKRCWVLYTKP